MQYQLSPFQAAGLSLEYRQSLSRFTNAILLTALPVLSVACEHHFGQAALTGTLIGKWFAFWAIGIRLLVAGFMQLTRKSNSRNHLSAREDSGMVKKATGVANLVLSALGFLCVASSEGSLLAAITVGVYLGLAGLQHDFKKPATASGWISLIYDFIVFSVIATCLVF
ncbi:hypothetical protein [Flavitalea sp.]|nr:hypothetical protein [Flavitalea sp.]